MASSLAKVPPEDSSADFAPPVIEPSAPDRDVPIALAMPVIVSPKPPSLSKGPDRRSASGDAIITALAGRGSGASSAVAFGSAGGFSSGLGCGFASAFAFGFSGAAGFDGAGLAAAGVVTPFGLLLNVDSAAQRWCLIDASIASRARPGDTGFSKKRYICPRLIRSIIVSPSSRRPATIATRRGTDLRRF